MKKYFILISAAIMALACTKELTDNQEAYNGEYKTITFESIATKTTIDMTNGKVAWEAGDEISIYYLADGQAKTAVATATAEGSKVSFTAQIPAEDNPAEYYAAYPKGAGVLDPSTGNFYLNVKNSICDGTFKSANFSASYTSADAMSLQFHNAVGMIKLAIPEGGQFTIGGVDYKLSGVYMRGQSGAFSGKNNNGPVKFDPSDGTFGDPVDLTVGETKYGDGDANINMPKLSAEALSLGYVYIPTLPGTWPTGLCIRYLADFEDVKNGALPAVLSQETPVEIKRGEVRELSDQTTKVHLNYYVSATGVGDGLTADTPMSFAKMQEKLNLAQKGYYGVYALQRVTFNILDGQHALASNIIVRKGYELYSMTIKGTDATKSILDGNETCGVIKVEHNVHLYLSNLKIYNGKDSKWGGLMCDWPNTATDNNSIVDCDNCWFEANKSPVNGAAVYVNDAANGGLVRFNGCSFTNNTASNGGGALYNQSGVAVMFNKCSFVGNTAGNNGLTIYSNAAKTRFGLNNCTLNCGTKNSDNCSGIAVKGYNVIANTTIWSQKGVGPRGLLAMGISNTLESTGSAVINCFLQNSKAESHKSIWLHSNYYQNISNCIFNGLNLDNTDAKHYTLNNCANYSGEAVGKGYINNKKVNGLVQYAYTWTWTDSYKEQMTPVTVEEVNQEIETVPNIGPLFMNWLKTIPNSLDTDIYGVSRTPASCPGSYQQDGTPVGQ